MKRICELLATEADGQQQVVGRIALENGKVSGEAATDEWKAGVSAILARANLTDGGKRQVTAEGDPEAWFEALPMNYDGAYFRARIVETKES
ncbi:MAG TPA: hypothetical protein VKV17_11270 [Bryobacteraceae bacterium]|nr:hypothetical protein [Bryobacteraceae bacterium]